MDGWTKSLLIGAWLSLFLLTGSTGWGYEEAPVTGGGTLTGKVFLKGAPPPARIYHLIFSPNIDFCGKISDGRGNRLLKEFLVAPDGGLRNAVIAVVGVPRGKPFDYTPELTIEHCRIAPFVVPVRDRHPILLVNKDPIAHDVQAYTLRNEYTFAMFNKPLPPETIAGKPVRLREGHTFFRTQCGVHDYMQSWGMAVGNPYFSVSDADGRFQIENLPPGEYDVIAWHPHMRARAGSIKIEPNGKTEWDVEFDAAEIGIPLHDLQTQFRLDTALQPRHLTPPSVELQRD